MAIEIRPVSGMEQLERWVAIQNDVFPDHPETASMKALVRAQESGHLDLLAYLDGEPVGTAMVADDPESQTSGRPWVEVRVLEEQRGRGVGAALFGAASAHARERGATGLTCEVRASDPYSQAFLERRGFVEYGRFRQCSVDLTSRPAQPRATPAGVELAWFADRPSLLEGMYDVAVATYPELGGHRARHAESFTDWQVYELGSPETLLEEVPVAVADDRVVGYATMRRLRGGDTAELRTIVVLPARRREGVASAVVAAQLARAQEAGIARVTARVRHTSPSGFFAALGFDVAEGTILLRGPLLKRLGPPPKRRAEAVPSCGRD